MNKKFTYEEALKRQMDNLNVPNEDDAWQKMKGLLDENDKRKPLAYFKNNKALSLLIILFLIGAGLFVNDIKQTKEKPVAKFETNNFSKQKSFTDNNIKTVHPPLTNQLNTTESNSSTSANSKSDHSNKFNNNPANSTKLETQSATPRLVKENKAIVIRLKESNKSKQKGYSNTPLKNAAKDEVAGMKTSITTNQNNPESLSANETIPSKKSHSNDALTDAKTETSESISNQQKVVTAIKADTIAKDITTGKNVIAKNNKKFILSAGVGVQQQIPVAGQKAVSYGYNGITNTLSDYIPSVFVRLEKDHQWFVQAEYVYSTPQLIREFSYNRQTIVNNLAGTITTTNLHLKKTFYNQLPLSFNYYIYKNWSVGLGGVYNILHGAISEKEISTNNVLTQTQLVTKQVVPIADYTDSFLYKSHMYFLVQTDYNWRRLSLGLRYSVDLQPYIKYTTPEGTVTSQKNWALEFILRFKLFKTRNF